MYVVSFLFLFLLLDFIESASENEIKISTIAIELKIFQERNRNCCGGDI